MGKKYASIHVFTKEEETMAVKLMKEYSANVPAIFKENKKSNLLDDESYKLLAEKIKHLMKPETLIIQGKGVISIYDPNNSFETISEIAQEVSIMSDTAVVYTSNFDEDVFLIGIYNKGNCVTNGNYGDMLEEYELESKMMDWNELAILCEDKSIGLLASLSRDTDIEEIEDYIEELLGVPLKLTLEEVGEYQEEYVFVASDEEKAQYCWSRTSLEL
ncbi:hypothetical protein [Anaerosporobacter sp.]|uniref:hypothetical protein n=1 Tax=Anaerosporobacter sp. TaxID=1872529 RepID=UPI00286F3BEF|nr:hypothetical protein [Anaerosporobacter sp.]